MITAANGAPDGATCALSKTANSIVFQLLERPQQITLPSISRRPCGLMYASTTPGSSGSPSTFTIGWNSLIRSRPKGFMIVSLMYTRTLPGSTYLLKTPPTCSSSIHLSYRADFCGSPNVGQFTSSAIFHSLLLIRRCALSGTFTPHLPTTVTPGSRIAVPQVVDPLRVPATTPDPTSIPEETIQRSGPKTKSANRQDRVAPRLRP